MSLPLARIRRIALMIDVEQLAVDAARAIGRAVIGSTLAYVGSPIPSAMLSVQFIPSVA
jgi:hypothetical protein